ncbi:HDL104Wp [Eremothecium sinecaudum]|uniref:F-actin-capping protein subunit beta n=1 Tax=Eremothecium sinecaudum TaxID=45286 RepID=A0A120K275_9SACH|nr:HDL104Wp [Eremothecium sinecaudum]AMD20640.1 HDL104Wp [Eremothecium sinecaudum]
MSDDKYAAALELLRCLDPDNLSNNLNSIIELEPDLAVDLLSSVDIPLSTKTDPKFQNREFLCCDYNRDIDSHRSPWSNEYFPELSPEELSESPFPSPTIRKLELLANDSMDIYRDLYYEAGVSSVYMWDLDEGSSDFAGVVLFKKGEHSKNHWDSIHVFEALEETSYDFKYRITTTIILNLKSEDGLTLSGKLTRQVEKTASVRPEKQEILHIDHITNLGTAIEDIESQMRNLLEIVYFDKSRDIYHLLRDNTSESQKINKEKHEDLIKGLQGL